jgi:hypothetical protein
LPASDPALPFVDDGYKSLKDLGCAFLDCVVVAAELEDVFAIGAAFAGEFLLDIVMLVVV